MGCPRWRALHSCPRATENRSPLERWHATILSWSFIHISYILWTCFKVFSSAMHKPRSPSLNVPSHLLCVMQYVQVWWWRIQLNEIAGMMMKSCALSTWWQQLWGSIPGEQRADRTSGSTKRVTFYICGLLKFTSQFWQLPTLKIQCKCVYSLALMDSL